MADAGAPAVLATAPDAVMLAHTVLAFAPAAVMLEDARSPAVLGSGSSGGYAGRYQRPQSLHLLQMRLCS